MKKTFTLLLATSMLAACSPHKDPKNRTSLVVSKFNSEIQGVWVDKDYIQRLRTSRSPYKSQGDLGGVASMFIDLSGVKGDSVVVGYSLNNHEGANFTLYKKRGRSPGSFVTNLLDYDVKTNRYEIGVVVSKNDTDLVLFHLSKAGKVIDKRMYSKVWTKAAVSEDAGWGIDYVTRKELITGSYLMVDSAGNKLTIEFNNNGEVSGFAHFKTYYINSDFNAGPENNLDEIIFDLDTKHPADYAFKIKADTLNIFTTKENADSTELYFDKLAYKLVRSK